MKWEGFSHWPPMWAGSYDPGDIFPVGEEGVLIDVKITGAESTMPLHLTLRIEHRGNTSSGLLCCDETEIIPRLHEILKACIGWPIGQIGDLDVDL